MWDAEIVRVSLCELVPWDNPGVLGHIPLFLSKKYDVGDTRSVALKYDWNEKDMDEVNPYLIEESYWAKNLILWKMVQAIWMMELTVKYRKLLRWRLLKNWEANLSDIQC